MQISTFFQPDLVWRKQLTPLIGPEEVDKMDSKLKEMHMKGLDGLQVFYTSMFPSPPSKLEAEFADLLRDIGAWPQVLYRENMKRKWWLLILDSRWVCPVFPHLALLSWHAGPGQQEAGGGHPAQVFGSPAKISWQKASYLDFNNYDTSIMKNFNPIPWDDNFLQRRKTCISIKWSSASSNSTNKIELL